MSFKNEHLSFSRIQRFAACPLSFKLHYIDKLPSEAGVPLRFGKAVHAALEVLVREHMEAERVGPLPVKRAQELWKEAFRAAELSGVEVFQEGLELVTSFIDAEGALDSKDVLAVEKRFEISAGPFTVLGFIDRVDRVDDETIRVIDYKTNRMLFSREEVDTSLQMSLYHLAAKQLWPWAKRILLTFDMLRHGVKLTTERTPEELDVALQYVEAMGIATETAEEFPARLNPNCIYCDHRHQCPAYQAALKGKRHHVAEDLTDLTEVAKEREEVANLTKILSARKSELEGVLKAHLEAHDELVLAGRRYRMSKSTTRSYPFNGTMDVLARLSGEAKEQVAGSLATVTKRAIDQYLKDLQGSVGKDQLTLARAELEAISTKRFSQRFNSQEVK